MTSKIGSLHHYKILVTGASGFLGSRLVQVLLGKGAFVVGVDYCNRFEQPITDFTNHESFRFICGDFLEKLDEAGSLLLSTKRKKSALFHMAGLANVKECEKNPSQAFGSNVWLTYHALEFCRNNDLNKFIFPSTGLVYGDDHNRPVTENDPTIPKNLYIATKVCAEALIQGYARSFGISCKIARLGNVYGPGGNLDTLVGTLVRQVKTGEKIMVHDLTPVRDYIYIEDVIEGFLHLLISKDDTDFTIVNLSTGTGTSVKKLADIVCQVAGIPSDKIQSQNISNNSISSLVLSNALMIKMTGWKPKYDLAKGLSLTLKKFN